MGTMPVTRTQVATLVSTALNEDFDNRGKSIDPIYKKVLRDFTPKTSVYVDVPTAYFGQIPEKGEYQPTNRDEYVIGLTRTTSPVSYGTSLMISTEAMDDLAKDAYGPRGNAQLLSFATVGRKFRDAANHTQEILAAQPFVSGNSATPTSLYPNAAGRDGLALASATHTLLKTGATFSNLESAATLSQTKIYNMWNSLATIPSDEGIYRKQPSNVTLVCGYANQKNALTAITTQQVTGSNNHDVSPIAKDFLGIKLVLSPYITGTSYALLDMDEDAGHKVFFCDFQPPRIKQDFDTNTESYQFTVFFRFAVNYSDPHGLIWSAGA